MKNPTFEYTYSKKQSDEVLKIREKYIERELSNYDKIKQLDESTTKKATVVSLAIGILGALIMGVGMSLIMVWEMMVVGIILGVVGMVVIALTYPLYNHMVDKAREEVRDEILRLCDEELKK